MGEMYGFVIFLLVVLVLLLLIASNIKIVPQATVYVVERLGGYHA